MFIGVYQIIVYTEIPHILNKNNSAAAARPTGVRSAPVVVVFIAYLRNLGIRQYVVYTNKYSLLLVPIVGIGV